MAEKTEQEKHDDLCVLLAAWLLEDAGVAIDEKALGAVIEASGNRIDPALPLLFAAVLDKQSDPGGGQKTNESDDRTDDESDGGDETEEEEEEERATTNVRKYRSTVVCTGRGPECEDLWIEEYDSDADY